MFAKTLTTVILCLLFKQSINESPSSCSPTDDSSESKSKYSQSYNEFFSAIAQAKTDFHPCSKCSCYEQKIKDDLSPFQGIGYEIKTMAKIQ